MPRRAITIRFPAALVTDARRRAGPSESFNDLVVAALERETRRRDGLATLRRIDELRNRIWATAGAQPESAPLIKRMREDRIGRG